MLDAGLRDGSATATDGFVGWLAGAAEKQSPINRLSSSRQGDLVQQGTYVLRFARHKML